jgi:hypothetical protein
MDLSATFDIEGWKENPFAEAPDSAKLTEANVTKTYHGDIEATSDTVWLMAYAQDGSATFVGIERISGTIGGRAGTLVLQHVGTYADGAAQADLTVVSGAGTGQLAGSSGSGALLADPTGKVSLDLEG